MEKSQGLKDIEKDTNFEKSSYYFEKEIEKLKLKLKESREQIYELENINFDLKTIEIPKVKASIEKKYQELERNYKNKSTLENEEIKILEQSKNELSKKFMESESRNRKLNFQVYDLKEENDSLMKKVLAHQNEIAEINKRNEERISNLNKELKNEKKFLLFKNCNNIQNNTNSSSKKARV